MMLKDWTATLLSTLWLLALLAEFPLVLLICSDPADGRKPATAAWWTLVLGTIVGLGSLAAFVAIAISGGGPQ